MKKVLLLIGIVFAFGCGSEQETKKSPIVWNYEVGEEICMKPKCVHGIITGKRTNYAGDSGYYLVEYFDNNGVRQKTSLKEFEMTEYKKPVKEILKEVFTGDKEEEDDYETEY